jgi:hypothetical protein
LDRYKILSNLIHLARTETMLYPKRSVNVYEETLEWELCLYDWKRQRLHTLNPTAALVWQQCDGQTSPADIAARLEAELSTPHADKLVWLSLDRLAKAHLLEPKPVLPADRRYTRREILKLAGVSLAVLPVVTSIVLPDPAAAQSPSCFSNSNDFGSACQAAGGTTSIPPRGSSTNCASCIAACEATLGTAFIGGVAFFDGANCLCCTA